MAPSPRANSRHIDRALTAAQHGAQGNHQQLMEIVQGGIAGPRILQTLPAGDELIQHDLPRRGVRANR